MNNKISATPVITKPGRDTSGSALEFDPGTPERARSFDSAMRNAERNESSRSTSRADFGDRQRSAAAARRATAHRTDLRNDRSKAAKSEITAESEVAKSEITAESEVAKSEVVTEAERSQSTTAQSETSEADRVARIAAQIVSDSDSEAISSELDTEAAIDTVSKLDVELVSDAVVDELSEVEQSAAEHAAQLAQMVTSTMQQEVDVERSPVQLAEISGRVQDQRSLELPVTDDQALLMTDELTNETTATAEQMLRADITQASEHTDTRSSEPEAGVQSDSAAPIVDELAGLLTSESDGEDASDSASVPLETAESTDGSGESSVDLSVDAAASAQAPASPLHDQQPSDAAVSLIGQTHSVIDLDAPAAESVVESMNLSAAEAAELAQAEAEAPAGDAVSRQVQRAIGAIANIGEGHHEFKIRLTPKELGSITIDIKASETGLAIALVTETSAANDRLNEQRQQLLQELAESGLDSSSVDISQQGQDFGSLLGKSMAGHNQSSNSNHTGSDGVGSEPSGSNQTVGTQRLGVNRASSQGRLDISL